MTCGKKKAPGAWQGNEGRAIDTEPRSKGSIMNQTTSAPTTTDKDWNGFTAADQHAIDEAEAQAWFDARPNIEHETVSSVYRGNREPVWMIIFDRFFEMHEIARAKRGEKRRNGTVTTPAGRVVDPESIVMQSLCNADEARYVDRARFMIIAGASL